MKDSPKTQNPKNSRDIPVPALEANAAPVPKNKNFETRYAVLIELPDATAQEDVCDGLKALGVKSKPVST